MWRKLHTLKFFMDERDFQKDLKKKLKDRFPGCLVLKNDPTFIQGIPDLLVLYNNKWAALEVKIRKTARRQPNQHYYISKMNEMSFASFIYPENEEDVLNEMEKALTNS